MEEISLPTRIDPSQGLGVKSDPNARESRRTIMNSSARYEKEMGGHNNGDLAEDV